MTAPAMTPQNAPLTPKSVMPLAAIRKVSAGGTVALIDVFGQVLAFEVKHAGQVTVQTSPLST